MYIHDGNRMAVKCADLIVKRHAPFTALYIYGKSGSGKTELLNYIEGEVLADNPEREVTWDITTYPDLFKNKWSGKKIPNEGRLFIVDDCFRKEKSIVRSSLFDLLNVINNTDNRVILTGNKSLDEYQKEYRSDIFESRIIDRLKWEMSVETRAPGRETVVKALQELAEKTNSIPESELESVIALIMDTEGSSIRNALSVLRRIIVRAEFMKKPVTRELAESILFENADIEIL